MTAIIRWNVPGAGEARGGLLIVPGAGEARGAGAIRRK